MIVERKTVKELALGWWLIGVAVLVAPPGAYGQQQQPQPTEPQDREVAVAPGEASQAQAEWLAVRVVRVKGDRIGEFEGLIKELATAMRAADRPVFEAWQVELGEMNTYHFVEPFQSFAEFEQMEPPMEPAEMAVWLQRTLGTIDSHQLMVARVHSDLSIEPQAQGGGEQPQLLMLLTQTVQPGRSQEYETWLRDEVLPALRQSEGMGLFSNQIAFGGDGRTWAFGLPLQGWTELDQPSPLHRALGQQAAEELLSRGDAMVERSRTIVLRMRPDLSTADDAAPAQ